MASAIMTDSPTRQVFTPFKLNSLELRNRFIRSAAFEGMTQGGKPSEELIEYHRKVSAGGVGMTTVAYAAVSASARTYGHQLSMVQSGIEQGLRRLTDAVHHEGAAASIQLGHCGYFASPAVTGMKTIGASRVFNLYGQSWPRPMTEKDMIDVAEDFARAAVRSRSVGFDAVEIHAGHGYLISQFLSPYTNRRRDRWGGSLENRFRFAGLVVRTVREAMGSDFPILVKMNLTDGFKGGLELDESVEIAKMFEREGVDALIPSGGFVTKTSLYMLRGDVPFKEFYEGQTTLTKKLGILMMGKVLIKEFPYRDTFFLDEARQIRQAVDIPLVLVGGLRKLDDMERCCAEEGFELLALARPLIIEPDLIDRMERGETTASKCEPCNKCVGVMDKGGIHCPRADELLGDGNKP
jgi:2,4-dienoyl-CoA reductase-like NADH-dependent reductase (Old Yellow Enzyme family)